MIWNLKPLQTKANVRVQELANAKAFHADHREDRYATTSNSTLNSMWFHDKMSGARLLLVCYGLIPIIKLYKRVNGKR